MKIKRLLAVLAFFFLFALPVLAQDEPILRNSPSGLILPMPEFQTGTSTGIAFSFTRRTSAPRCTVPGMTYFDTGLLKQRNCTVVGNPGTWETVASGSGVGNVVGPASAVSGHLAVFSDTSGKVIGDGGAVPSATPAGSDTQVQFNDGGSAFGGDAGLLYNKTTDTLTAGAFAGPLTGNVTGNVSGTAGGLSGTPALPNGTTATTQSQADASTKIATTAYVDTGLAGKLTATPTATQIESPLFCSDAGANDTYACNLAPAIGSYVVGTHYRFKANTANTGAASVNFNSLGALTIVKVAGGITTALADSDIRAGQWVDGVVAAGSNFQIQSTLGNAPAAGIGGSGTINSLLKWTPDGSTAGDSLVTDDGTTVALPSLASAANTLFINGGSGSGSGSFDTASETVVLGGVNAKLALDGTVGTSMIGRGGNTNLTVDSVARTIVATAAEGFSASGTATNDAASSGFIGEYQTASLASGSATSLTTATAKTITSVSLTAGDWDVWGVVDYVPAATTTTAVISQGISTTDNTLDGQDTFTASTGGNLTGTVLGSLLAANTPMRRISLAATTTVYLIGKAMFAVSTMTAYGSIFARRAR